MEHFIIYRRKIVPLTKEQGERLEKKGIPLSEIIEKNLAAEQEKAKNLPGSLMKPTFQSPAGGRKINYILFGRKKGF